MPHLLGGQAEDFSWVLERLPVEGTGICLDTSDWRHLISALERVGYEGVFMLEVAGDGEVPDHVARAWASAGRLLPAR